MSYGFPDDWAQEIADETTRSEYQNATVTLINPDLVDQTYDLDTGEYITIDDGSLWSGQARIIPVRWSTNRENSDLLNPNSTVSVRVQFPYDQNFAKTGCDPVYLVKRGWKLRVDESPRNTSLLKRVLTCVSDVQGSMAASRTVEFATDVDSVVNDG